MKSVLLSVLLLSSVSVFAANKAQISAALAVANIDSITSISEGPVQPKCFGCRVLTLTGVGYFGNATEKIAVQQTGSNSYDARIIEQSK